MSGGARGRSACGPPSTVRSTRTTPALAILGAAPRPASSPKPSPGAFKGGHTMNGADLLVAALENEGVKQIFGVPGEENLDIVEALRCSTIKLVVTRHEQPAAFMAATHGRLTGEAGVCLTTLTKMARQIVSPATIPSTAREAFRVAQQERPRPVHLELPEDIAAAESP